MRTMTCEIKGKAPDASFKVQLCKKMAKALRATAVASAADLTSTGEQLEFAAVITGNNSVSAVLKISTSAERAAGTVRMSKPIEVSISDSGLNESVIQSFADAAGFLEKSAQ